MLTELSSYLRKLAVQQYHQYEWNLSSLLSNINNEIYVKGSLNVFIRIITFACLLHARTRKGDHYYSRSSGGEVL